MADKIRVFAGRLERLVDGDTAYICFDTGFGQTLTLDVRLADINTPELRTPEGVEAERAARAWFTTVEEQYLKKLSSTIRAVSNKPIWPLVIVTAKNPRKDNYSRYLAKIWPALDPNGESLNAYLVRTGHALKFDVGKGGV